MKEEMPFAKFQTCPRCYVGRIKSANKMLVMDLGTEFIQVPEFPAWECDVCHTFVYDKTALDQLMVMLSSSDNGRDQAWLHKAAKKASATEIGTSPRAKPAALHGS